MPSTDCRMPYDAAVRARDKASRLSLCVCMRMWSGSALDQSQKRRSLFLTENLFSFKLFFRFLSHTFIVNHSKSLTQQCVGVYQGMCVCMYIQLICQKNVNSRLSDIITEFGIFCVRVRLVVELIHVFIHSNN